jgi:hypothetical protein
MNRARHRRGRWGFTGMIPPRPTPLLRDHPQVGKSSPSLIEASGWIVSTEPSFVNDSQQRSTRAQGLPVNSSSESQCFPPFETGERLQPIICGSSVLICQHRQEVDKIAVNVADVLGRLRVDFAPMRHIPQIAPRWDSRWSRQGSINRQATELSCGLEMPAVVRMIPRNLATLRYRAFKKLLSIGLVEVVGFRIPNG